MNCFRINADKYASFIAIKGNCSALRVSHLDIIAAVL